MFAEKNPLVSANPLEFWFDFASTYSYVAAMQIETLCAQRGVPLQWKPFLLGPIFALQGWNDSPFNLSKLRGAYMWRDLERLTAKHGLPWRKPSVFPRNSTLAARVACATANEPWSGALISRIFVANFGEDADIADAELIDRCAREAGGGSECVAKALAPERRGWLRRNTSQAIALGIFGAPNCVVGGELFWGEEALEDALAWAEREP